MLWLLGGCRPPGVDVGGAAAPVRSACAGASVDKRVRQLRRGPTPRRRASCPVPSSGQHFFTGKGLLPVTATPASGSFAGGNGASPCPPVRTGFAGAGGPVKVASSGQLGLDGGEDSSTTPAPANILSQEKDYYR